VKPSSLRTRGHGPTLHDTQHQQCCWLCVSTDWLRWSYYVLYQDFVVGGGIGESKVSKVSPPPGPFLAALAHAVATWVAAAACCLCANACIPVSGA
jgi:hypothetical protein